MIYFDNAATTYPKPQCVYDAINEGMQKFSFNAGRGSYKAATETYKMIEETREKLASFVSCSKEKVIFTSSATESLNNIIYGLDIKSGDNVYVSPFEHNAIIRTLENCHANIRIIPFNKDTWEVDIVKFENELIINNPKAILISQISNVTGYMLPYEKIFDVSKKYNTINVLDAAQGFGIYQINKKDIDFIVFAGHKSLYAMFGIAGYININNTKLRLYKVGGTGSDSLNPSMPDTLPSRYEAGSLNSVGIYSLYKSIDFIKNNKFDIIKKELIEYFINQVKSIKKVIIYLPNNYISYGIISFNVKGYAADEVGNILYDDFDICVRTGYHCAPYIHEFIGSIDYNGTIRISLSGFNSKAEIDLLIEALHKL